MILVTLGTQDKSFKRLLDNIQQEVDNGNIKDKVIVQAGFTKYESEDMEIFDLVDRDKFNSLINECDLLITHGGVGSILTGLKNNKKVIVCPRLAKYKEHINDHQVQIVNNFYKNGYILKYEEDDDLGDILKKVDKFKPKKYKSNTNRMIKLIDKFINDN
jgi:UDP-N-acetylglucosamine transferase subunit ALG13